VVTGICGGGVYYCIRRALGSTGVFLGVVGRGDVVVADDDVVGCLM